MAPTSDELRRTFNLFDANHDGAICLQELIDVARKLGMEQSETELQSMLESVDTNNDGLVDFTEFLSLYNDHLAGGSGLCQKPDHENCIDEELSDAFSFFDRDHDGFITDTELHSVLHNLGFHKAMLEVKKMINSVDADGDGKVNFQEFKTMMCKTLAVL